MKTLSLFLILSSFLICGTSAGDCSPVPGGKNKRLIARYKADVVVDGNSAEWTPEEFEFNEETQAAYAIANDTANLFLCIKLAGEMQQMKALHGGMEVWIDTKAKKNKVTGIRFPLPNAVSALEKSAMRNNESTDRKKVRLMYLLQLKDMQLSGFREGCNGFVSNKSNQTGIAAMINWDSTNCLVYEAKIPLKDFKEDLAVLPAFTVGIIMKGLPQSDEQRRENRRDSQGDMGDMGGAGGYPSQGSMSRGSERSLPGGSQKMFDDGAVWQQAAIARKQ